MIIVDACRNCRWSFICGVETEAGLLCDEYELDILSDDYVDGIIEMKREEYIEDYEWYLGEAQC